MPCQHSGAKRSNACPRNLRCLQSSNFHIFQVFCSLTLELQTFIPGHVTFHPDILEGSERTDKIIHFFRPDIYLEHSQPFQAFRCAGSLFLQHLPRLVIDILCLRNDLLCVCIFCVSRYTFYSTGDAGQRRTTQQDKRHRHFIFLLS